MSTFSISLHGWECHCASPEHKTDRVCYLLSFMPLDLSDVETLAGLYGLNLAVISGFDWDNELTPWPAPGEPPGEPPFQGHAAITLRTLQQEVIPSVERRLEVNPSSVRRSVAGVSLSGLFALWAWLTCDTFTNLASLSGSFWYDGFAVWATERIRKLSPEQLKVREGATIIFLLGKKEDKSPVRAFRSVTERTGEIVDAMRSAGLGVTFTMVPGDHYSNFAPRLHSALAALSGR